MNGQLELFRLPHTADAGSGRQQHIILSGRIVGYALRRDRQRLAMRIDERGLRVGAPRWTALTDIEAFIRQHADWVLAKLGEFTSGASTRHLPIHEGARVPILGGEATVRVIAGNNQGYWKDDVLWLAARPQADLSGLARRTLQRRALEYFRPRLAEAAQRLQQPLPSLSLSNARTRWGSCSPQTGIRLNWRLVHLPPPLIDYVIVHEAAHLVEMNHSARFWRTVDRLYPGWETARAELRHLGAALPLI